MKEDREHRDVYGEVGRLRHRRAEVVRHRERAVERAAFFPSDVNTRMLGELDEELRRIDANLLALGVRA